MFCGFPLTTTLKQRKGKIKSQSSRPMDARRRSRWWQIRNYRVVKLILEVLENVTWKFPLHHMFNALERNKVSNQNCGLGRTHATRLGRCCCCHAKIVKNWLNATLCHLWILREIRRCSKITLARLTLWNKVMNSNEIRIKPSIWSVWFSSMFSIFTSWYDVSHAMGFRGWERSSIKNHPLTHSLN